ncbi:Mrp/NBP35 family ATP-binding protein [Candidatus Woesearchaeota archaeon]|nr:Mrp/NBP35 family ATP-binding protein [Candidatus Woesearchaeota archaeon]
MRKSILVMSGKGGVGKTTVAVNLAYSLFLKGFKIGILDVDIHGPNVLKMLGYENVKMQMKDEKIFPLVIDERLKVASLAGFVEDNEAVIWRGPKKHGAIKQLSQDVEWGELDFLVVDFPPGTGDEHLSAAELLNDIYGAIIVSTPQKVSLMDMVRSIDFCNAVNIPIIGAIENMSDGIFGSGTVEEKCNLEKIRFLGKIQLSKTIVQKSEDGEPFITSDDNSLKEDFNKIVQAITSNC